MSRFLTVDETSELLRVKRQTIYKWICQKKIPSISVGGRTLFDEQELIAWISSGKRQLVSSINPSEIKSHSVSVGFRAE